MAEVPAYVTLKRAAQILGVHEQTLRNWEKSGVIRLARLPGSGYRRVPVDEIKRLQGEMTLTRQESGVQIVPPPQDAESLAEARALAEVVCAELTDLESETTLDEVLEFEARADVVVIDTDVLVLAYAFHRDTRQATNTQFLDLVQALQPATTIYSVMELLGKLSFNLSAGRLSQWPQWLQTRYRLSILYPRTAGMTASTFFHRECVALPFAKMQQYQMPFLGALILNLAEAAPDVDAFVTWNARHYQSKTALNVVTPAEYLDATDDTALPQAGNGPNR